MKEESIRDDHTKEITTHDNIEEAEELSQTKSNVDESTNPQSNATKSSIDDKEEKEEQESLQSPSEEKKKFPSWTLGVATILALASVMPIVFVAVLRKLGITKPHVDYEAGSPLKRIETNASSAPMMPTVSCLSSFNSQSKV